MAPVGYIPKTQEYYRRLGYPLPYKYSRFDTRPWAERTSATAAA
jgi:hypothetical protein